MALRVLVLIAFAGGAHAWGGVFNRLSADMLDSLGYGRGGYRTYPYARVEPEEVYAEALQGNRLDEMNDEGSCYASPCVSSSDCCQSFGCLNTESGGRCLPEMYGRKMGEVCTRENQCDAGLVCELVLPGEMRVCRPPSVGQKQYNAECTTSSECDISRGLCCMLQRRHRQKARKSCGYFKEPLVCIGPVAVDQVREIVQHTAGEKRIGVFQLH